VLISVSGVYCTGFVDHTGYISWPKETSDS